MRVRTARLRVLVAATCLVTGLVWTAPAAVPALAASTINVPADYATLQAAIDAAAAGDTIKVAAGTYTGHSTVDKTLTIESATGAEATILDGQADGFPIIAADLTAGESITVRGVHFLHGQASIDDLGGALKLTGAGGASVIENIFEYNNAPDAGGAIYSELSGTLTIARNRFLHNSANEGGAIWMSDPAATTSVDSNVFLYNSAYNAFGASVHWSSNSAANGPLIRSNTIVGGFGSQAYEIAGWGALEGATIRNNIVAANSSVAGIYCYTTTNFLPTFTTNDVWNTGTGGRHGGNCSSGDAPTDLNVDPKFADPDWDDVHLRADSPLIDAGTADPAVTTDIDGDARPFDGDETGGAQIDIGADESVDPLLVTPGSLSFAAVEYTLHVDKAITLQNLGSADLSITGTSITGTGASEYDIQAETCSGETLSVDETCSITVRFAPTSSHGFVDAFLTIQGPGAVGTRNLHLSGEARDPVSVGSAGFGAVALGSTANATFTIDNQSASQAISITSIGLAGGEAAEFAITDDSCADAPIAAGATCTISVSFTPAALGTRQTEVTVTGPTPVGTRHASLDGEGAPPVTPVTWATPTKPGGSYAWNFGNALARTVKDGSQRLHQAYATDRISGTWAKDSGPYAGIYYTRSTTGATWTTPRRVTSTSRHVVRFGLAAAGSRVYLAYVTQTKIINYSGSAPRVLYIRVNTNHGHGDYWKSSVRLTGTTGRVDYPTVAASGTDVHVAFTNSSTGGIIVASSKDRGLTWVKRTVGSTSYNTTSGRAGVPSIAVSGSTVAVSWISTGNRALVTRISTDRGATWGPTVEHANSSVGDFQTAVRGSQAGVAFVHSNALLFRLGDAAGWEDPRELHTNGQPYAPSIALQAPSRIALSWAEETATSNFVALKYAESTDNGVVWYQPQTIASTSTSTRRINDWPTIVWPSAGTRYVSWNGWTSGTNNYRLYLRKGTGTPSGVTTTSSVVATGAGSTASVSRSQKTDATRPR